MSSTIHQSEDSPDVARNDPCGVPLVRTILVILRTGNSNRIHAFQLHAMALRLVDKTMMMMGIMKMMIMVMVMGM